MTLDATNGSLGWQIVFVSFAVALILFELIRGWRLGLMRQVVRVFAVIAAYVGAIFGGRLLVPVARPFLRMPDFVVALLAGAVLALVVYSIISNLGKILFKRTAQHSLSIVRTLSGAGGAVIGFMFGAFLVWLVIAGVRLLGSVADGQFHTRATNARPEAVHTIYSPDLDPAPKQEEPRPLLALLARLKNSVELGNVGEVVKRSDFVTSTTYETLAEVGQVISNPTAAERFLNFPGARELSENPKIVALRDDSEIANLLAHGRLFDLLQNEKILDAANDPLLAQQIRRFDLKGALDYALEK